MIAFRTYTGRQIDLEHLKEEDIDIRDIARGLSFCCRFSGHLEHFYSVAQHSVLVSTLAPDHQLAGLLHDASEAYLGDLSRHLKHHPWLEGYRRLEERVQSTIDGAFGVTRSPAVKVADDMAALIEHITLREGGPMTLDGFERLIDEGFVQSDLGDLLGAMPYMPRTWLPWHPAEAERYFLTIFQQVTHA